MARLWPPLAVILALVWLAQPPPAGWGLGLAGWQAPALLTLLAGVFGLLHLSSNYLQSRVVGCAVRWTHNVDRANLVYFTLMRPGVLVHELAHAMAAALVGGRIVGFNVGRARHLALPPAWWEAIRQDTLVLVVVLAVSIALNWLLGGLFGLLAGLFRR